MDQGRVVLQSLYSGNAREANATNFASLVARARSDVFFSLLFGNRIVISSEVLFDSPIALSVFGEILEHIDFEFCEKWGWFPFEIVTEDQKFAGTITEFVHYRWNQIEKPSSLWRSEDVDLREYGRSFRSTAADAIKNRRFDRLFQIFDRLRKNHQVGVIDSDTATVKLIENYPPIIQDTTIFVTYIVNVLKYIEKFKGNVHYKLPSYSMDIIRANFKIHEIIRYRGENVVNNGELESSGVSDSFMGQLDEFKSIGVLEVMGDFFKFSESVFGENFGLVQNWIEIDYHETRVDAYGADRVLPCILSDIKYDIVDKNPLVYYRSNENIDVELRIDRKLSCYKVDLSTLKTFISDSLWVKSIVRARSDDGVAGTGVTELCDYISKREVGIKADQQGGSFRVIGDNIVGLGGIASMATAIGSSYIAEFNLPINEAVLFVAGAGASSVWAANNVTSVKPIRYVLEKNRQKVLRTYLAPRYLIADAHRHRD